MRAAGVTGTVAKPGTVAPAPRQPLRLSGPPGLRAAVLSAPVGQPEPESP